MSGLLILFALALALLIAMLTLMLAWGMRRPPRHTVGYAIARNLPADPGELDLLFESWSLDRPNGIALPVWDIQIVNRQSSIQNPLTAVFIHGWGHSRIDSLARIKPLDELCSRLILYDLRGHGDTPGSSPLGHGEDADLLALIERIDGPVVLIAHSMGAVIALNAMIRSTKSHNVIGIIAYGPYCEFHRSLIGRLRSANLPSRPITDLALLNHRLCGIRPASVDPELLKSLQIPLLVIHGSRDIVSPIDHGRRIAAAAPNSTLIEVPEAGHTDAHIKDAALHDAAVRDFIRHIATSPPPM